MKKVTMDDVAREAGCSRAQVSRMLSGKSYVAEELRVRIQAALKRMNYRNRANRHRIRLAIIVKELIGLFQNRLLDALMKDILRRKWECCIIPEQNKTLVSERFYDGAVCSVYAREWARKWAEERGMPLVMLNSYGTTFDNICSIDPDTYDESRRVLEHLKSLGHRRIAHVTTFKGERFGDERAEAFLAEMAKRSLPVKTEWIYRDECFRSGGPLVPFLERLFSEPERPTAVSCGNDLIALRVMTALERQGIRIPEEVSVIGYSDLSFGVACEPELTTIHQPFDRMGETAVKLALDGGEREVLIPTELVVRGSTASPC